MPKVHRVAKLTTRYRDVFDVAPTVSASTVGKMKLFRKIVKAECTEFADVIGVGRFASGPNRLPVSRRI